VWVEGGDVHDELLDQLGGVLAPPADLELAPSAAELEALAAAVAARWPGGASAPASESQTAPVRQFPPGGRRPWRRVGSSAWRAGSVAAGIVIFSASAAAAAGGVPLPRPVRAVAYNVGLPVDSPALDDTNHHIKELKDAVKAQDKPKAEATTRRIQSDLTKVPKDEKKEAVDKAQPVVQAAVNAGLIPAPAPPLAPPPATSSTTVTTSPPATTVTTAGSEKENDKGKDKPSGSPTTTDPTTSTTTTTAPPETTTTTAPSDPGSGGSPSGDPGTGSGDPSAGGAGSGGGGQGTTATTAPPDTTTTTTAPASSGDPATTTTTTTTEPPTTTTTTAPPDAGIASTTPTQP
jgi:hypothetical protein